MNAGNKKHTQHTSSTKTECDYLNGWLNPYLTRKSSESSTVGPREPRLDLGSRPGRLGSCKSVEVAGKMCDGMFTSHVNAIINICADL